MSDVAVSLNRSQLISLGVKASDGSPAIVGGRMSNIADSFDSSASRPYLQRVADEPSTDSEVALARIALKDFKPADVSDAVQKGIGPWADHCDGAAIRAALLTLQGFAPRGWESLMIEQGRQTRQQPELAAMLLQAGRDTFKVCHRSADIHIGDKIAVGAVRRYLEALKNTDSPLRHAATAVLQVQGTFLGALAASEAMFGGICLTTYHDKAPQERPGTVADQTAADLAFMGKQAIKAQFVTNTDFSDPNWREVNEKADIDRMGEIGRVFLNRIANDDGVTPDYGSSSLKDFARMVRGAVGAVSDPKTACLMTEAALTVLCDPHAVGKSPDQLLGMMGHAVWSEKAIDHDFIRFNRLEGAQPFLDRLTQSQDPFTAGAAQLAMEVPSESRRQPGLAAFSTASRSL